MTFKIMADELEKFAQDALQAVGVDVEDAAITARVLVTADLEGVASHGVSRLPLYVRRVAAGLIKAVPQMTWDHQSGAVAVMDADNGLGPVAAWQAMNKAVALAEEAGVGAVTVHHSNHCGAMSVYCNRATEDGMIGMAFTNSPPGIPPLGGRKPYFGTNPVAISFPGGLDGPVVVDLATSVVARGQIILAAGSGQAIPSGWAIDAAGRPTRDPRKALRGAVLPMAGGKGYALALAVEILCGVLSGAGFGPRVRSPYDDWDHPSNVGHFLMALNVSSFMPPEMYLERMGTLIQEVKAVPLAEGFESIRIPGERRMRESERGRKGGVELSKETTGELEKLASEVAISFPPEKSYRFLI